METTNEGAIEVLNSLIETTLDSANGYRNAADATDNMEFQTMFAARSAERLELSRRLQQEVRSFGGEPEQDQSVLGKAHNKFAELRGKLMGDSDKGLIDEVERGEDVIVAKFERALGEDLPVRLREVVSEACETIRADHDRISQLKRQMH